VARFDRIIDKLNLLSEMIEDDSHREYAIRVLEAVGPFVERRLGVLSIGELNLLTFQLARLIGALERLPATERAYSGADKIRVDLERAKDRIVLQGAIVRNRR
jgi:hypothetical protein